MTDPRYSVEPIDPSENLPRAVLCRLKAPNGPSPLYGYEYLHPAVAATLALYDRSRNAYLLIRRGQDPFKGFYAFPGGFIDVGREDIEQTAMRELYEETGVEIARGDLRLVDVRSAPDRDPRDHVFDIGYLAEVEHAEARAREETTGVRWASPEELDSMALAFDHGQLWKAVRKMRG